jgi:hypothetical protein
MGGINRPIGVGGNPVVPDPPPVLGVLRKQGDTAPVGDFIAAGAVQGIDRVNDANGFIAGTDPHFAQHTGVFGESDQLGVYGSATGANGTGVYGNGGTTGFGIRGDCTHNQDAAIKGVNKGTGPAIHGVGTLAGFFEGNVTGTGDHNCGGNMKVAGNHECGGTLSIAGDLNTTGNHNCKGDIFLAHADCAEEFDVSGAGPAEPGTVMVITDDDSLKPSLIAYDKRVAGIISGAGGLQAGIILNRQPQGARSPIALVGTVYCKVDAQYGAIDVGDLLTTSPTCGHAMKASEPTKSFGAVIGKALRPMAKGRGMVPVLVSLQ